MTPRAARRRLGAAAALALLAAAAGCDPGSGRIEGRAVADGAGVAGVAIEAYATAERRPGTPPVATATTGAGGSFSLALPPGPWWLVARETAPAGPPLVGAPAGGPVLLATGAVVAVGDVVMQRAGGGPAPAPAGAGIRGRAVVAGGPPAADAAVMVYDGARDRPAGPGYLALVRTGPDGSFQADLAPGAYRVAIRRRGEGGSTGFLREGDLSAEAGSGPLAVAAGAYLDLGDVELHPVDRERLAAEKARGYQGAATTAIEGRVVDREGKPRGGLFVFVFRDEGMIGRPAAVAPTAPDGAFSLALPGGGKYWVGAREGRGGPRRPGEWSGAFRGTPDGGLEVAEGRRVKGMTIEVGREW